MVMDGFRNLFTAKKPADVNDPRNADAPLFFVDPFARTTVIGASLKGASHEVDGKPCQDAYRVSAGSFSSKPWVSLAVADGHGADKHDLSEHGSAIVCKGACELLEDVAYRHSAGADFNLDLFMKDRFPKELRREWLLATGAHFRENQQSEGLDGQGGDRGNYHPSRYGTTFLAAFALADALHVFRLGDGDIILKLADGSIGAVFKDHEELSGSETYSFSSDNALDKFEYKQVDLSENVQAAFLSTDGLTNAYPDPETFHAFLDAVHHQVLRFGAQPVAELLPEALKKRRPSEAETTSPFWCSCSASNSPSMRPLKKLLKSRVLTVLTKPLQLMIRRRKTPRSKWTLQNLNLHGR